MTNLSSAQRAGSHFSLRRLTHFNFQVTDLEGSLDFYRNVMGFNIAFELPALQSSFFSNGSTNHDLALMSSYGGNGDGGPSRLHHLAFELENEVDLVTGYESARAEGVEFLALAAHTVSHGVYVTDPDGVSSEIYADIVKDWRAEIADSIANPRPKLPWTPGQTPAVSESCYPVDPQLEFVEGAVFKPERPTSVCLVAEDLIATTEFYQQMMGLEPVYGGKERGFVVLAGTTKEPAVAVFQAGPGMEPGVHHYSVRVAPDFDQEAALDGLAGRGIQARAVPENALRKVVMVTDPLNGFTLQMFAAGAGDFSVLDTMSAADVIEVV